MDEVNLAEREVLTNATDTIAAIFFLPKDLLELFIYFFFFVGAAFVPPNQPGSCHPIVWMCLMVSALCFSKTFCCIWWCLHSQPLPKSQPVLPAVGHSRISSMVYLTVVRIVGTSFRQKIVMTCALPVLKVITWQRPCRRSSAWTAVTSSSHSLIRSTGL